MRIPRRGGGWLRIDASLLDTDAGGGWRSSSTRPASPVAPLIAAAYGLSAREREVTGLVLQRRSTEEIGRHMHVSAYTVQDHLKAIFGKVGVRSRRELVAELFPPTVRAATPRGHSA